MAIVMIAVIVGVLAVVLPRVSQGNDASSARGLGEEVPPACQRVLEEIAALGVRQARTGASSNTANYELSVLQSQLNNLSAAMAAPAGRASEAVTIDPSAASSSGFGTPKPLPSDLRAYLLGTPSPSPTAGSRSDELAALQEEYDATVKKIYEVNARLADLEALINEQADEAKRLDAERRRQCVGAPSSQSP